MAFIQMLGHIKKKRLENDTESIDTECSDGISLHCNGRDLFSVRAVGL
jgi:hypothetical protein